MKKKVMLLIGLMFIGIIAVSGCIGNQSVDVTKVHTGEPLPQVSRAIPSANVPQQTNTTETRPIDNPFGSMFPVIMIVIVLGVLLTSLMSFARSY